MFALDKQAHFFAGAAIAALCVAYGTPPMVSFVAASIVAGAKEVWDRMGYGTPDIWDFVATMVGAAAVLPLAFMPS